MITVRTTVIGAREVVERIEVLTPAIRAGLKTTLDSWSTELASYIKENKLSGNPLNRRTGDLSASITPYRDDQGDVLTGGAGGGAGLDYAKPLEFGARPHEIVPRTGRFLRFEMDGRIVYARKVNHPGNRPFRYMRDSFDENVEDGVSQLRAAVREAMVA